MILSSKIFAVILGLYSISLKHVEAGNFFKTDHVKHHETHENELKLTTYEPVDYYLYMKFVCQGKPNGLRVPVPKSCTDYFECQDGSARRLACMNGMHFSEVDFSCNEAQLSKCKHKNSEVPVKCEGPCCYKEDGLYPDSRNCNNYIVCVNGEPHYQTCGASLKFCAESLICDIPERARCNKIEERSVFQKKNQLKKQIIFERPTMYLISHRVCQNVSDGVSVPIFGSCNKYYLCIRNEGHLMSCGKMQFNHELSLCDGRTRIHCPEFEKGDVILDEDEYPSVNEIPFDKSEEDNWFHYTLYPQGNPTTHKPQQEQKPNVDGTLIWTPQPEIIEGENELQPPHRNPVNGLLPIPEPLPQFPPVVGQENDPFYRPQSGGGQVQKPSTSVQNPATNKPDIRPYATTPYPKPPVEVLPKESNVVNIDYKNVCNDQPIGSMLPVPQNCNKYISCRWDWFEKRVAEVMSCPQDKHFNALLKICDLPQNAGCIAY